MMAHGDYCPRCGTNHDLFKNCSLPIEPGVPVPGSISRDLLNARNEIERLRKALDRDKTGLAAALAAVREEVKGRRWICDGRGSYAYDDDRYRKETGFALDAIEKIAADALAASGKLAHDALTATSEKCKATLSGIHWATSLDGLCPACGENVKT